MCWRASVYERERARSWQALKKNSCAKFSLHSSPSPTTRHSASQRRSRLRCTCNVLSREILFFRSARDPESLGYCGTDTPQQDARGSISRLSASSSSRPLLLGALSAVSGRSKACCLSDFHEIGSTSFPDAVGLTFAPGIRSYRYRRHGGRSSGPRLL